jgi:hypothetical protein
MTRFTLGVVVAGWLVAQSGCCLPQFYFGCPPSCCETSYCATQQDEAGAYMAERLPHDRPAQQVSAPMADLPPKPRATDTF